MLRLISRGFLRVVNFYPVSKDGRTFPVEGEKKKKICNYPDCFVQANIKFIFSFQVHMQEGHTGNFLICCNFTNRQLRINSLSLYIVLYLKWSITKRIEFFSYKRLKCSCERDGKLYRTGSFIVHFLNDFIASVHGITQSWTELSTHAPVINFLPHLLVRSFTI